MISLLSRLVLAAAALSALATMPARAQAPVQAAIQIPAQTAHEAGAPAPTPALWKIADKDTTIYLFGTIHVLPKGINWFGGQVADAFAASGSLVTEIAGHDDAAMQGLVVSLAMLPEGTSLRDQMSGPERAAFESALGTYQVSPALLDRFEPWYAAVALSTLPLMQQGYAPEHGVEQTLEELAAKRRLPHTGLETVEYQLGLFDGLPADVQKRYLGEVIGQLPNIRQEIGAMVEAWKIGDADELARLMNANESDSLLIETLLTGRNRTWAKWLDERMDQPGTVFVAVGAGHLAGEGSVQNQLAARGIATIRVQ
jgi:uncharacterized protein YbaP (TraB family)